MNILDDESDTYARRQRALNDSYNRNREVKDWKMDTEELLKERAKTHGDFSDHAEATQSLKEVFSNYENFLLMSAPHREALEMIAHKIGRILAGDPNFRDHWDDIAGYAKLAAERCSK